MPSVFTIEGTATRGRRSRSRSRRRLGDHASADDTTSGNENCKWVKNPTTGCETKLCFVGKAHSRSGWKFMKGTTRCTRTR
jgi:hypothetical protein